MSNILNALNGQAELNRSTLGLIDNLAEQIQNLAEAMKLQQKQINLLAEHVGLRVAPRND